MGALVPLPRVTTALCQNPPSLLVRVQGQGSTKGCMQPIPAHGFSPCSLAAGADSRPVSPACEVVARHRTCFLPLPPLPCSFCSPGILLYPAVSLLLLVPLSEEQTGQRLIPGSSGQQDEPAQQQPPQVGHSWVIVAFEDLPEVL